MKLTEQEEGAGLVVVVCKCCRNVYKTHKTSNATSYGFTPNFGCSKCRGVVPMDKKIAAQLKGGMK